MGHNYTRAQGQAARLLAADSGLSHRATNLRGALESIAKYGVMGFGTAFAQYANDHRLYDQLVDKGLVVVTGEKLQRRWTLAPATKARFDEYVAHFQAEIDAAEAVERAAREAAEEVMRHAVILVSLETGESITANVYTGANGKSIAEQQARGQAEIDPSYKAFVVRLTDINN